MTLSTERWLALALCALAGTAAAQADLASEPATEPEAAMTQAAGPADAAESGAPAGNPPTLGDTQYRRPTGPVNIEAQSADILRDGTAVYRGNVRISANEFSLDGEQLELHQHEGRQFTIVVTGAPAHFAHLGNGADAPPVDASANRIEYDSRSGIVELDGGVQLLRGRDSLSTEHLRYDIAERRIQASGGSGGQVRITLDPDQIERDGERTPE